MARARRSVLDLRVRFALAVAVVTANVAGAGVVLVLAAWVLPEGPLEDPGLVRLLNLVTFGGYLLLAVPVGVLWGSKRFRVRRSGDAAEARREHRMVLYGPLRLVTVQAVLWAVATAVFATLNAQFSLRLAISVAETVMLGGITTCALSYLLTERILRRTAARVLAEQPPRRLLGQHAGGRPAQDALGEQVGQCARGDATQHHGLGDRYRQAQGELGVERGEHGGGDGPEHGLDGDQPQRPVEHHAVLAPGLGRVAGPADTEPLAAPQHPDGHREEQVAAERHEVEQPHQARILERALGEHPGREHEHDARTGHVGRHHRDREREPDAQVEHRPSGASHGARS